jgi:hypothetical protein
MRIRVRRRHEACVRAQNVCTEYRELFDATPGGQTARAELDAHIAAVDRLLVSQEQSIQARRAATEQCRRSRRHLRADAKAAIRVGRIVNLDAAILDTMQLGDNRSADELLAFSRSVLEHVSSHADALLAKGLPPDLPARLAADIDAFAAARATQAASVRGFRAATRSILAALDDAGKTLDVLEAIADNRRDDPPEVLDKLRMARRVGPRVTPVPKAPPSTPSDKAA